MRIKEQETRLTLLEHDDDDDDDDDKYTTYPALEIADEVLFINSSKFHRKTHGDAVN